MSYHPKIRLTISSTIVDSKTVFQLVKQKYDIVYCGIYTNQDDVYIYIHNRNRMVPNVLSKLLSGVIEILGIHKYDRLEGVLCDDTGKILQHGGHKKPGKKQRKVLQYPESTSSPIPSAKKLKSPITLPNPESKISFVLNPPTHTSHPDNFHPIWSSKNGHWAPYFWVGPSRNIKVSKRVQPTPKQLERLFWLQDNHCRLCENQVFMGTYSNADVDHIVPLILGGETVESNLQILCVCCHRRKTSLESRKIMVRMTEPEVVLEPDVVYSINSHVFFELDSVKPLDVKGSLGADPGMYKLFY